MFSFLIQTPACQKGYCQCKPCFIYNGTACVAEKQLSQLDAQCNGGANEVITVNGATCRNGYVSCKSGFSREGQRCKAVSSCATEDKCMETNRYCDTYQNNVCACYKMEERFDEEENRCVGRGYGDECTWPDNCGGGDYASVFFYSKGGGTCNDGKCGCTGNSVTYNVTRHYKFADRFQNQTICISKEVPAGRVNLKENQMCSLDPISMSHNVTWLSACGEGYTCFQCPEDVDKGIDKRTDGFCRALGKKSWFGSSKCGVESIKEEPDTTTTTTTTAKPTAKPVQSLAAGNSQASKDVEVNVTIGFGKTNQSVSTLGKGKHTFFFDLSFYFCLCSKL